VVDLCTEYFLWHSVYGSACEFQHADAYESHTNVDSNELAYTVGRLVGNLVSRSEGTRTFGSNEEARLVDQRIREQKHLSFKNKFFATHPTQRPTT